MFWAYGVRLEVGHTFLGFLNTRHDLHGRVGSGMSCWRQGEFRRRWIEFFCFRYKEHCSLHICCGFNFFFSLYGAKQIRKCKESLCNECVIHQRWFRCSTFMLSLIASLHHWLPKSLLNCVELYDDDGYNMTQCSWEPYVFKDEISDNFIPWMNYCNITYLNLVLWVCCQVYVMISRVKMKAC